MPYGSDSAIFVDLPVLCVFFLAAGVRSQKKRVRLFLGFRVFLVDRIWRMYAKTRAKISCELVTPYRC
jgi:hypothetical protein